MRNRLHSLKFAMGEAYLARYDAGGVVVEVRDHRNDNFTLTIGSSDPMPFSSPEAIEDWIAEYRDGYVKGSRVWELIEEDV